MLLVILLWYEILKFILVIDDGHFCAFGYTSGNDSVENVTVIATVSAIVIAILFIFFYVLLLLF